MSVGRRRGLIAVGSWLIVVLSLLPAITYMGHWGAGSAQDHAHQDAVSEHELHCHGGVSQCAGSEAMVGTTWIGEASNTLSFDAPDRLVEHQASIAALDDEPFRADRPPRGFAAF